MKNKNYKIQYLPCFKDDLCEACAYIKNILHNGAAADKLLKDVEEAIIERSKYPTSFEPYQSCNNRTYDYYRIKVGNYFVFYVVYDDVMEIRAFIYASRNISRIL